MRYVWNLLLRVILCFVPVALFDAVLIPLVSAFVYYLLPGATLIGNSLVFQGFSFRIVEACVASFAFYLIWVLALLSKDLTWKKRVGVVLTGWGLLLIANVFRILLLVWVALNLGMYWFDGLHFFLWYLVSGVFVAIVWFILVSAFRIPGVPAVDDLRTIWKMVKK